MEHSVVSREFQTFFGDDVDDSLAEHSICRVYSLLISKTALSASMTLSSSVPILQIQQDSSRQKHPVSSSEGRGCARAISSKKDN